MLSTMRKCKHSLRNRVMTVAGFFLFTDGRAVKVGCYDARVKKLQLFGQGNVWPGNYFIGLKINILAVY